MPSPYLHRSGSCYRSSCLFVLTFADFDTMSSTKMRCCQWLYRYILIILLYSCSWISVLHARLARGILKMPQFKIENFKKIGDDENSNVPCPIARLLRETGNIFFSITVRGSVRKIISWCPAAYFCRNSSVWHLFFLKVLPWPFPDSCIHQKVYSSLFC